VLGLVCSAKSLESFPDSLLISDHSKHFTPPIATAQRARRIKDTKAVSHRDFVLLVLSEGCSRRVDRCKCARTLTREARIGGRHQTNRGSAMITACRQWRRTQRQARVVMARSLSWQRERRQSQRGQEACRDNNGAVGQRKGQCGAFLDEPFARCPDLCRRSSQKEWIRIYITCPYWIRFDRFYQL
jgi:hypothetical protein